MIQNSIQYQKTNDQKDGDVLIDRTNKDTKKDQIKA